MILKTIIFIHLLENYVLIPVSLLVLLPLLNLFLLLGENRDLGRFVLAVVIFSVVVVVLSSSLDNVHSQPFFLRFPHFWSTIIPVFPN